MWNIQIKVNPTQVRDVMPHPVCSIGYSYLPSEDREAEDELEAHSPDHVAPPDVAGVRRDEEAEGQERDDAEAGGEALGLHSVQQFHFGSPFAFRHFTGWSN